MASRGLGHRVSDAALLFGVLASLPAALLILWFNYAAVVLTEQRSRIFRRNRRKPSSTVFLTGTSTVHGLNTARAFYREGYRVVAADLDRHGSLNVAPRSRAISKHYAIPQLSPKQDSSYAARCMYIVAKQEHADLWVDCSQDISLETITLAQQQIQQGTPCTCIAADDANLQLLKSKETLLDFLRTKQLPAPEIHTVKSRGEIHNVLNHSQGKKQYLLKSPGKPKPFNPRDMLPRRTLSQTYQEVSMVKVGPNSKMVLEEYYDPSNTYQCSAVVVRGVVKAFWARQRTGAFNNNFDEKSALWKALRAYTNSITYELGQSFTSHLTVVFLLNEKVTSAGVVQQVLPIESSIHLDPTFLFPRSLKGPNQLVQAYTSALQQGSNSSSSSSKQGNTVETPANDVTSDTRQRYLLSVSLRDLAFAPCMQALTRRISPVQSAASVLTLIQRVLFWDEAYYDFYDPMPFLWRYTVVLAWDTIAGN